VSLRWRHAIVDERLRVTQNIDRGLANMSSWGVQFVIGKLVTDDAFRRRFETSAHDSLLTLCEQGIDLTDTELVALLETNQHLWSATAKQLDPRLRANRARRVMARNGSWPLTYRERRVLRGIFQGRTNKQIGVELGVSESSIKGTLQQLFRKTQVRTRLQLVRMIVEGSLDDARAGVT
jgi:DNA-binding NarL/FixJ family response regulator